MAGMIPSSAYLIKTLKGNTRIAIPGHGYESFQWWPVRGELTKKQDYEWFLWSPADPKKVNDAQWSEAWEATPLPPDSSLVIQARDAIQADLDQRAARAKARAEEALRAEIDYAHAEREREIRAATYLMWRPSALTRKDLIARGWTMKLMQELPESAIERKSTGGGHASRTYLYDPAVVAYAEERIRGDLDRILARRAKVQQRKANP